MLWLMLGVLVGFTLGVVWMAHLHRVRERLALRRRLWLTMDLQARSGHPVFFAEDASDHIPEHTFARN